MIACLLTIEATLSIINKKVKEITPSPLLTGNITRRIIAALRGQQPLNE